MLLNQFKDTVFSNIKDRLPADCWAVRRNVHNHGELDEETVLYYDGDVTLAELNLDNPLGTSIHPENAPMPADSILLIFIDGNLKVEGLIGNENDDGATGLIVTGDVTAGNVVVGGQELYIAGSIRVSELFWGNYNHGSLNVKGDLEAAVIAATEEYDISTGGKLVSKRTLLQFSGSDDDWGFMDAEELEKIFASECINDDTEGDHATLWREDVLRLLRSGKSVIKPEGLEVRPPNIPFIFPNRELSIENIFRLSDLSLISLEQGERNLGCYDFRKGATAFRVSQYVQKGARNPWRKVYVEHEPDIAIVLSVDLQREKRSFWQILTGKRAETHWELTQRMRLPGDRKRDWRVMDEAAPTEIKSIRDAAWTTLLEAASTFDYARKLISPSDVRSMLALPVAEPYDNFYTDHNGFWARDLFVAFRQDGFISDGEREDGLIRVSKEARAANGETVTEHFFFILQRQADGSECVVIEYMPDQEREGERFALSYLGGRKLDVAHRIFRLARRKLLMANNELLEGEPPDEDDEFALAHWRKKGYLRDEN